MFIVLGVYNFGWWTKAGKNNSISLAYKRSVDFEMLFSRQRENCVIVLENKIVSIGRVPVFVTVGL